MAYYSTEILEESLKTAVRDDWFPKFEYKNFGRVDFCICRGKNNLLWGEAKRGTSHDIYESFVQLILTIGKERTFDDYMPPTYLCAFDAEKIAFIEYHKVMDIFTMNDFNWKVTPSDHSSTEFKVLQSRVQKVLEEENLLYYYDTNEAELKDFIKKLQEVEPQKFQISKNNFIHIYREWEREVKPTIGQNWEEVRKMGYLESDFYLADLLSENNKTLTKKLTILLESDHYRQNVGVDESGGRLFKEIVFKDDQKAHRQFWAKYERPPKEEYWEYIVSRRDLLVPVDVRERKGSFFTPQKWVRLSQEYLAQTLGEDWQEEYYVWDCCAGTGNLLMGLSNPERVYASTIDKADVSAINETLVSKGQLLEGNVFQFDFLNDKYSKLPENLIEIIEKEPEKLVVYINPPYAEAGNARSMTKTGKAKAGVAVENIYNRKYKEKLQSATNELFALFLFRIYCEIPGCIIGQFSTLKHLQGVNYGDFRGLFKAKLCSLFLVPANTFDNVKGQFPIGFFIWDTKIKEHFKEITADVYDKDGNPLKKKEIKSYDQKRLNDWRADFRLVTERYVGILASDTADFQCNNHTRICQKKTNGHLSFTKISQDNLISVCVYFSVRLCIPATLLNNRDQFLYPKDSWKTDTEFRNDCLAYTLFHGQNRISSKQGVNHFIPFKETEVKSKKSYKSRFLLDYLSGKLQPQEKNQIFQQQQKKKNEPITFSLEAQAVMDCAKELYKYYHQQENAESDASFYDIRLYFQGAKNGRMNSSSDNNTYNDLLKRLREAQKVLADKIAQKVYEHGFLEE